jgi:hypothetical protein
MSEHDVKPRQPPEDEADDEPREYSSSPCYLHEFEPPPTVTDKKKNPGSAPANPLSDPFDPADAPAPKETPQS